jgi:hypothetical protein
MGSGGFGIKLRILQDCSDEEMAVITAALGAHLDSGADEAVAGMTGWKYSGRASWHGIGFFGTHSMRNSRITTWRRVGLYRFG